MEYRIEPSSLRRKTLFGADACARNHGRFYRRVFGQQLLGARLERGLFRVGLSGNAIPVRRVGKHPFQASGGDRGRNASPLVTYPIETGTRPELCNYLDRDFRGRRGSSCAALAELI